MYRSRASHLLVRHLTTGWLTSTNTQVQAENDDSSTEIIHVPGKQLVAADALLRVPLGPENTTECKSLDREYKFDIDYVMELIPATKTKLNQIKDIQNRDGTMRQL